MAVILLSVNSITAFAAQDSSTNTDWWYEAVTDDSDTSPLNSLTPQPVDIDNLDKLPAYKSPEPANKEDRVVIMKDCLMKSQGEVLNVDAIAGKESNYYNLWQVLSFLFPSATAYTNAVQTGRTTLNDAGRYLTITVDSDIMPGKKYVFSSMGAPVFASTDTGHANPLYKSRVGILGKGGENEITDIHDYDYIVYKNNLYISGWELTYLFNLMTMDTKTDYVNPVTRCIVTERYWDAVAKGTEKFPDILSQSPGNPQAKPSQSTSANTTTDATSKKATDPDIYHAAPSDKTPLPSVLNQTPLKTKWYPSIGQTVRWGYAVGTVKAIKDGRVQCKWIGYYDFTGLYFKGMPKNVFVELFLNIPSDSNWLRISEIRVVS
jgi:hypothetical protein